MKKSVKKVVALLSLLALFTGVIGFTTAYFSDTKKASNVFKVGNVTIDLKEDNWNDQDDNNNGIPDVAENIVPLKVLSKDPSISNIGENECYCYIEVKIPVANVITINDDGSKNEARDNELFMMQELDTTNWTLLNKTNKDSDGNAVYVYGYNEALSSGNETSKLFTSVKFANVIEGQELENKQLNIEVKAMAIQKEEAGTMQEAYQKYLAQNQ